MTILLYAQPYQIGVDGFYFRSADEYAATYPTIRDRYGEQVEEFKIQLIDASAINCALAGAWGLNQANVRRFFEVAQDWDDAAKLGFIVAVGEAGYDFDPETVTSASFDVDLYFLDSLKDLAEEFLEEGLFGDIPERLRFYIDTDAIARDLACDYTATEIAGTRLIYRID